jgi:DNA-binding NarL/FixJ family response regulator
MARARVRAPYSAWALGKRPILGGVSGVTHAMTVTAPTTAEIRVVVVDDHRTFAELLALALRAQPDMDCIGIAHSVEQALHLLGALSPDLVVMDVQLGDGDGIAATAQLTKTFPDLRVVVLTAIVNPSLMRRALEAGACALLRKDGALEEMLHALRSAQRGGFAVHPELLMELVKNNPAIPLPSLTERERQVLQLLAAAEDTRSIARELGISVSTCRGYVKNLLAKLGAHSQLEAVVIAMRHGLIYAGSPD